jgi:hypothetical protein
MPDVSNAAVMNQLRQSGPGGNGPMGSPPGGLASSTPPMTAPMSTPEPQEGGAANARVKAAQALDLLELSLPDFGSESPDGQAALAAIKALHRIVGQKRGQIDELQPTEARNLLQNLPHGGGAPPGLGAMAGQPQIPGLGGSSPMPGAPPASPPSPMGGAPTPPPPGGAPPSPLGGM